MGMLIDGKWTRGGFTKKEDKGHFKRMDSVFRNWVTKDGVAGPSGMGGFKAEAGRYHLYISHACPWAHRTVIFRKLKGLEEAISLSVVDHFMGQDGWGFNPHDGGTKDHLFGKTHLHEIYTKALPSYTGRVTVPILWDKEQNTIVSNESSEIIRMFNSAFIGIANDAHDYFPAALQADIDEINDMIYHNVNNGVYKCGFATTQDAYALNFGKLFATLDYLDNHLNEHRYLMGDVMTEADWRLFTTLIRFDAVYVSHFKCNKKRIADYENLSSYLRELYQMDGIKETINMHHIKHHYFGSHESINPTRIVPEGPDLDFEAPHGRAQHKSDRAATHFALKAN